MTVLTPACGPTAPVVAGKDARAAVGQQTPSRGSLAIVTLHNWSPSPSLAVHQMGHVFRKGDVPAGSTVVARRQDTGAAVMVALDGCASWSDGSLAFAGLFIIDDTGDIAGNAQRRYELIVRRAKRVPPATSFDPWQWLSRNTDLRVELSGMASGSSATAMSPPQRDIVLNEHAAVGSRRTRHLDHWRVQVLKCWGMAAADGHLKGEHYITLFRASNGAVLGAWYECAIAQDWVVTDPGFGAAAEPKTKRHYFATLKNGATTLESYYGDGVSARIQHPYYCGWATVQRSGDSAGLPFWIAGSKPQPTLWAEIDTPYWIESGLLAPYDHGVGYSATLNEHSYDPFAAFNYVPGIDQTGGSNNRGWITTLDVARLLSQSTVNDRSHRVQALAGLHCPYRARNHLPAASVGDVTNLSVPFQVQMAATSASGDLVTGELPGLGQRQLYQGVNGGGLTLTFGPYTDGYSTPKANWVPSGDSSHAPAWGYFPALLTGRRIFRDMAIDNAMSHVWKAAGGCIKMRHPEIIYGGRAATGWPTRYFTPLPYEGQTRALGWQINVLANGWRVTEDDSSLKTHLRELIDVNARSQKVRLDTVVAQPSTTQADRRLLFYYHKINSQEWENHILLSGYCRAAVMVDDSDDLHEAADWMAARPIKLAASDYPLLIANIWTQTHNQNGVYSPPTTDVVPGDYGCNSCSVRVADPTILDLGGGSGSRTYKNRCPPAVGDRVRFSPTNAAGMPTAGLMLNSDYYIVALPATKQVRISITPGGDPITMTSGGPGFAMWTLEPQVLLNATDVNDIALQMSPYDNGDDYFQMGLAALAWAQRRPNAAAAGSDLSRAVVRARAMATSYGPQLESGLRAGAYNPSWMLVLPKA